MLKLAGGIFTLLSMILFGIPMLGTQEIGAGRKPAEEWCIVLIHGAIGLQANLTFNTIIQAKNDTIEGTVYERNVLALRENPYLFTLQPIQKLGFHPVKKPSGALDDCMNAAYMFQTLYREMQDICSIREKNTFYTFGWSGLISEKRRYTEACLLYKKIKQKILEGKKRGVKVKIRLIGYSHGATLLLNLGDIREDEFPSDTFLIDETFLIGIPVTIPTHQQILSPLFKKMWSIYSRGDKVQRLDIFSPCDFLSHREFKGYVPPHVTQIEMRYTARLQRNPCYCLPPNMRGIINQSPGHIELWYFGWAPSSYRKNLHMHPMPGAIFIPYLTCAAQKLPCQHVIVDLRPDQNSTRITSKYGYDCVIMPFIPQNCYKRLLEKAMSFHPNNPKYRECFLTLQSRIGASDFK